MSRSRVYELARELGLENRELVARIAALGIPVRNHMSSLDLGDVERIKRAIEKDKQKNVVEERIRPTVVRRRVRRPKPAEAAAASAPAGEAAAPAESPAPPPSEEVAAPAPKPVEAAPEPPAAPARPSVAKKPRKPAEPEVPAAASAAAEQPEAPAAAAASAGVAAESPKPAAAPPPEAEAPARSDHPPPAAVRLQHDNLPPGVVARGNRVAPGVGPLSEGARSRIISQHAARQADSGLAPPRRRELARSAIGPTGRQQTRQGRPGRARKIAPGKRAQKTEITTPSAQKRVIRIEDQIGLQVLAARMSLKATDVLMKLMQIGMTGVNINSSLDADTAKILANEFGYEVENVAVSEDDVIAEARGEFADVEADRESRPPVITVMGHVDHGKTSLLDRLRNADVVSGEAGGITQHLGAYQVETPQGKLVFLDTPGHAAFTAMRARGANVTDVVILVVAADDGVMPQTKEAISHSKAAKVPIVVAVNKIDREDARPEVIMRDLANEGLQPEEWGGDTIFVNVSAKTGQGLDKLLESVALQAELLELSANPAIPAEGVVIESYLDKGRGPVANVLVRNGTLETGSFVVSGVASGRVRAMTDDRGKQASKAGPSMPVEVLGMQEVPEAGGPFHVVKDAKAAQQIAERRRSSLKSSAGPSGPAAAKAGLDQLFQKMQQGEVQELKLVIKADVQGSVEALVKALTDLSTDKVRVSVVHSGVGAVTENDVMLASASNAIVIGFHVRPAGAAVKTAKAEQVEVRTYTIIYEVVDDVKKAMTGLLAPAYVEKALGKAEVRQTFSIPKIGTIAGCYVTDGKVVRSAKARVVRDSVTVWEGKIRSLRRIKDDVREVSYGFECGVGLENFNDVKERDVIECFDMEEVAASL